MFHILRKGKSIEEGNLEPYQKNFITFNSKYWKDAYKSESSRTLLVEGMLGKMPTHLLRLGIAAKAMENYKDIKPVVILTSREDRSKEMFESFGIDEFVYLKETIPSFLDLMLILFTFFKFLKKRSVKSLLETKYKSIYIGKQIYDSILKEYVDCYTVEKIEKKHYRLVLSGLLFAARYEAIIRRNNVDTVLLSHNEYLQYGTLAAAALCQRKKVMVVNDIEVSAYRLPGQMYWHNRFHKDILRVLEKEDNKKLREEGETYLHERIYGNSGLFDTKNAFGNKKMYTRKELKEKYSHNDNKNVFIFMHVFSDAPHLSEMSMYNDYFDWIMDTIKEIQYIKDVNWYIKIHPCAHLYGETENIRGILMLEQHDNVFFVPDDYNPASIKETADAVVTSQGTVGIEAASMGIPVIVTGEPFYRGFGFTVSPHTRKQYHEILHKCSRIKKLSEEKREISLAVTGAFNRVKYIDKSLLDDDVYKYAGYDGDICYSKAYEALISNMGKQKYTDLFLYKKVRDVIETHNL